MADDLDTALRDNPFVPPKSDICFIDNLPPELLSQMFEVGSASDAVVETKNVPGDHDREDKEGINNKEHSGPAGLSSSPSPWTSLPNVVSHVCRHWRSVAFSTPSLWTTITVTSVARPPYELQSTLLERSKSLPIDIYVTLVPHEHKSDGEEPSDGDVKFLFSMLTPHVYRWHTVNITVSDYHQMYQYLVAASGSSTTAPQLTTLELCCYDGSDSYELNLSKNLVLFGGFAPLLTTVVLWGVPVDWSQPWITSAPNLKDLKLAFHREDDRPSWAHFSTILRGAPSLEKLCLLQSGPSGEPLEWFIEQTPASPTDLNTPVQLAQVTDLTLAFHSQRYAIGLLQKFCLPQLKNLVLRFEFGDYTDFVRELARPTTSLSPAQEQPCSLLGRLESLKISGLPCRSASIRTLYRELQNLTSLNLSLRLRLSMLFLSVLCEPCTLRGSGDIWLPRLDTLYVSGASGTVLRETVQKRMDAGVPLSSLYLDKWCMLDEKDVEWLKKSVKTVQFLELV